MNRKQRRAAQKGKPKPRPQKGFRPRNLRDPLSAKLAIAQVQAEDRIQSPANREAMENAPRITDEEALAVTPDAFLLWIGKPEVIAGDTAEIYASGETEKVVLTQNGSPVGYPTQGEAEAFLASDEGQNFIGAVFNQGYTEVGVRGINRGGYPLWDMLLYTAEPEELDDRDPLQNPRHIEHLLEETV